jgi:hypothetical protein
MTNAIFVTIEFSLEASHQIDPISLSMRFQHASPSHVLSAESGYYGVSQALFFPDQDHSQNHGQYDFD